MASPDYQRIAALERELGIGQPDPEPERGVYPPKTVCLIKNCGGDTVKVLNWAGMVLRCLHTHQP